MTFSWLCIYNRGELLRKYCNHALLKRQLNKFALFLFEIPRQKVCTRGVDPNKFNFDLDPEFWSNLDPDPGLNVHIIRFEEKNHLK